MSKIFISYRREDSIETVGRLYDWLSARLPPDSIFMDLESIPPGTDFRASIRDAIASTQVMLVIIGKQWLALQDTNGVRRIDDTDDFVRIEIELAMQNRVPIIPVLIQRMSMPHLNDLPESLQQLTYYSAIELRPNPDFSNDLKRVMRSIESIVPAIKFADVPAIPEGAIQEPGFYFTRVIALEVPENGFFVVNKEFAFSTSPSNTHAIGARLYLRGFPFELAQFIPDRRHIQLQVMVDDTNIDDTVLSFDAHKVGSNRADGYARKFTLSGHEYNIKIHLNYAVTESRPTLLGHRWSGRLNEVVFQVTVDGFTLLEVEFDQANTSNNS